MGLDVKTLYLINISVLMLSAAAGAWFWRHYPDTPWPLWWALATGLSAAGLMLLAIFGPRPTPAIGGPAIVLLFAGYVLVWETMRQFNGRPPLRWKFLWLVLGFAAAFAIAVALDVPVGHRAALAAAALAILAVLAAAELLRGRADERLRSRFILAAIFLVMAGLFGLRAGLPFLRPAEVSARGYYDPLHGLLPMANSISIVCLGIGLMMMANERMSRRHRRLALTDELTGLANRRSFLDRAGRAAQRATRNGGKAHVLMMDLDRFSALNERFGHAGGDAALVAFADLLRRHLRPEDAVARYGGEEFCALLADVDDAQALAAAESLRARLAAQPLDIHGQPWPVTVSIGVAPVVDGDVEAAILHADAALYRAKAEGRNRVAGAPAATAPAAGPSRSGIAA
ncbi:MAG: GGDEF domain-containing protein [Dongiaceae bacterium]